MSFDFIEGEDDDFFQRSYLTTKKRLAPFGVHIPNKEEAKELRRLQQKSGMTEKELRAQKVYRVKLANARKRSTQGTGKNARRLEMRELRKQAAMELGTHINDPRVNGLAESKFRAHYFSYRRRDFYCRSKP